MNYSTVIPVFPGPGVFFDMPAAQYHSIPAIGSSVLKKLHLGCPMEARHLEQEGVEETDDMFLGTVAHALALEAAAFDSRFCVGEKCSATKKGDGQSCKNDGLICCRGEWFCGVHGKGFTHDEPRQVVTLDEATDARGMVAALRGHKEAARLLWGPGEDEGSSEVSFFAICPVTGLPLKARADRYLPRGAGGRPVFADLKKMQSGNPNWFLRQARDRALWLQAGHYCRVASLATGIDHGAFEFIAAAGEAPWAPSCIDVGAKLLRMGIDQSVSALETYAACRAADFWPSYDAWGRAVVADLDERGYPVIA